MINDPRRRRGLILLSGAFLGAAGIVVLAGHLEPPGPPASTMQTLIRAADLPMTITTPGLYALEADIDASVLAGGITISSSNVTVDLRGHSLRGGPGDGIATGGAGFIDIEVKNGTVADWVGDGIDIVDAENCVVRDVRAHNNGGDGIRVGQGSAVLDSVARDNTGDGIELGSTGCTVSRCSSGVNGGNGFTSGLGAHTVSYCSAYNNTLTGFNLSGAGTTVTSCSARDNNDDGILVGVGGTISNCTSLSNGDAAGDDGIVASIGSSITGCTSTQNDEDGIQVSSDCYVARNNSRLNGGAVADGAGVHSTSSNNRIDENNVTDNDVGIAVDSLDSIVIRNSASGNTTNYVIAAGNSVGEIVGPLAVIDETVGPWANHSY